MLAGGATSSGGMAALPTFTCRRDFYETDDLAVLTLFAKGVPDEGHVRLTLDVAGQQLEGALTVPGRGACRFVADLAAAVDGPVAVALSPSRVKVRGNATPPRPLRLAADHHAAAAAVAGGAADGEEAAGALVCVCVWRVWG